MNKSSNITLAVLSAVVIGAVNAASVGAVYVVFSNARKPPVSEFTKIDIAEKVSLDDSNSSSDNATSDADSAGDTNDQAPQPSTTASDSATPTPANGSPAPIGSAGTPTPKATSGSSPSAGGGSSPAVTPAPAATPIKTAPTPVPTPAPPPASLAKGAPCQTQTPPAGVCASVLSFNSQKDGNPNWNATLLAEVKKGIADNAFVKTFGLNVNDIYNSMQITLQESTWSGNATKGTIGGKMGAAGQSQATTFMLDWNGSKWIVNGISQ